MKRLEDLYWKKLDYKKSLDFYLALKIEKYGFNPNEVIVWYYDKTQNHIIFQSDYKYFQLKNNKVKEINKNDVWHKKSN